MAGLFDEQYPVLPLAGAGPDRSGLFAEAFAGYQPPAPDYVGQVAARVRGLLGLLQPGQWQEQLGPAAWEALAPQLEQRTARAQAPGESPGYREIMDLALNFGPGPMGLLGQIVHHGGPHKWAPETIPDELPSWAPAERMAQWRTARANAALPVEQGGLGLGPANTAAERAKAMGAKDRIRSEFVRKAWQLGSDDRAAAGGYPGKAYYYSLPAEELDKRIVGSSNKPTGALWDYAQEAGLRGYDLPMVETGYRYGLAPSAKSWNYGDNYPELGISMADVNSPTASNDWEKTVSAMFVKPIREKQYYQGWFSPGLLGSDGEPMLSGVTKTTSRMSNAVIPAVEIGTGKTRSRFAAFDPMRRNEADLLASWLLPLVLGAGAASYGLLGQPPVD